jgi:ABC-type multidrug transport system ATPase subunit
MSGLLLKVILKLFALVAKEDGVDKDERDVVELFLLDNLNPNDVKELMDDFDVYVARISKEEYTLREEIKRLTDLCEQVNQELTYQQKVVVIMELVGIMLADGEISNHEIMLVQSIGAAFNIDDEIVENIEAFVKAKTVDELISENVAIVNGQKYDDPTIKHIYRPEMKGFLAFLRVSGESDCYFIKYFGKSNVYLNGNPLKLGKVKPLAPGSSVRRDGSTPIYFGAIVSLFMGNGKSAPISFEAHNIEFRFPNGKLGLKNINMHEKSGNLIAIMGSSGAGKSTLCNVLNGSEKPSKGKILINGIDIHKQAGKIEGLIGFVPQDDLLIEDLTSYENLFYAAKLCFDQYSNKEIDELVLKTMSNLGILEIKNLKVGSPLSKTISGGQRKRLNIGLELLREPSVLFVDEPTSGLSSRDAENIMDLLKELTLRGKLIFVVIHQPSSDIFKMFDKLIIMDVGGLMIYNGNPIEAVVYFKKLIDLINSEQGECIECGNINPEQIFNIIENKVVNEYGNLTNERKISPERWHEYFHFYHPEKKSVDVETEKPKSTLRRPSKFQQMWVFIKRDVLAKLANRQYLVINLLEAPLLAFLLAFILKYSDTEAYTFGKNINMPAFLFMSVIVALFMGLTVSAEEIIKDRKILKRESFLNLSRVSYLLSKIGILFTISAIQTLLFTVVGNSILEIEGMFWTTWAILFSASCLSNIVGLNISSAFNSAITIYILIPILIIPQLILSGVVVQFDNLNPKITSYSYVPVIGDVMASRWAFEAAMVTHFKDNAFEKQFYELDKKMGQASYKKLYYLPALESKLNYVANAKNRSNEKAYDDALKLLRNEINNELKLVGKERFPEVEKLTKDQFDSTVYRKARVFLSTMRNVYNNRFNDANDEKNAILRQMTDTPEKMKAFLDMQNKYSNESIADIVTGKTRLTRILEDRHQLVQQSNLIYQDPNPSYLLDFRQQFYTPSKHFLGSTIDTLYFNIGMIWFFAIVFSMTLYFDILRKIISGVENFRKYRRK